jgi:periplasmic protein TonB
MVDSRSAFTSVAIHLAGLLLLIGLVTHPLVTVTPPPVSNIRLSLLNPYTSPPGGGGQHSSTPASAGHPPKAAPRQFVLPAPVINLDPKLVLAQAIEALSDIPDLKLPNLGDPTGLAALSSAGRGGPAGYGDGPGTGTGSSNGASTGTVYGPGGGITLPVPIHKVEPEFSEEARKARANGIVMVYAEIGPDGKPHNIRIARSFGLGLDEKALEAVSKWLFKPGTKNGKPVTVAASIEVSFHLL